MVHEIVLDADHHLDRGIVGERRAELLAQRRLDPLRRRAGMIDARAPAGRLDPHRDARPQHLAPGDFSRPLVELRQVHGAKAGDPRQHPRGAPELEIGPPHLRPAAAQQHPALDRPRVGKPRLARFIAERRLEPGKGHEEDIETIIHAASIAAERMAGDVFLEVCAAPRGQPRVAKPRPNMHPPSPEDAMAEKLDTLALHGGEGARVVGEPVGPSPVLSTTYFTHPDAVGFSATELGADAPHFYSRWSNPTLDLLEKRLALLEGGEAALVFASGMAAITGLFAERLKAGDHLVLSDVCYAGVAEYARHQLRRQGVEVSHVDTSDPERVVAATAAEHAARPYRDAGQPDPEAHRHRRGGGDRACRRRRTLGRFHHRHPGRHQPAGARRRLCLPLAHQVPLRPWRRAGRRGDRAGRAHRGAAAGEPDPPGRGAVALRRPPDPEGDRDADPQDGKARGQCPGPRRVAGGASRRCGGSSGPGFRAIRRPSWPGGRCAISRGF